MIGRIDRRESGGSGAGLSWRSGGPYTQSYCPPCGSDRRPLSPAEGAARSCLVVAIGGMFNRMISTLAEQRTRVPT